MMMPAPLGRVNLVALTKAKAREKGADSDHYRIGLPPGHATDRAGGYGNRRVSRTRTAPQWRRSREILPRSEAEGSPRARWNGGYRARALVRTSHGGTGFRAVDRRPRGDQGRTRSQAEDGPRGCSTLVEAVAGRSFSARVGPRSGESGSASAAVASTSAGADEDSGHEPVAGRRYE